MMAFTCSFSDKSFRISLFVPSLFVCHVQLLVCPFFHENIESTISSKNHFLLVQFDLFSFVFTSSQLLFLFVLFHFASLFVGVLLFDHDLPKLDKESIILLNSHFLFSILDLCSGKFMSGNHQSVIISE